MLQFLSKNFTKIIVIALLSFVVVFGVQSIRQVQQNIIALSQQIESSFQASELTQDVRFTLNLKCLFVVMEQLQVIQQENQFIIDQNRAKIEKETQSTKEVPTNKPTYEELKSHCVYIEGYSGKKDLKSTESFQLGDEGEGWSGTGIVIKITDTETYIMTNNHVTGKGEKNVKLYVENGKEKIKAVVVKNHPTEDVAVIKVEGKLIGKTIIPGIAFVSYQDPVYVVGNPLGVKYIYSEGVVAGYEDTSMLIQMPLIYGNSGSGVYDKNGKLVGIVYALEQYPGFLGIPMARITHSLIVDSITIKPFLKDLGLI
jgi:S1-C subfamily serine protease